MFRSSRVGALNRRRAELTSLKRDGKRRPTLPTKSPSFARHRPAFGETYRPLAAEARLRGRLTRMTVSVTFPGSLDIRAGGADQHDSTTPDWGVYADPCWEGWPGVLLAWPDFDVPRDDEQVVSAIVEAV